MFRTVAAILVCTASIAASDASAQLRVVGKRKEVFKGSDGISAVAMSAVSTVFVSDGKAIQMECVDNALKTRWTATLQQGGYLHAAKKFGKNVLVIVSTGEKTFGAWNSEFKGVLVDAASGKTIKETTLFKGNDDYITIPYISLSPDGKELTFATRETAVKRGFKMGLPGAAGMIYAIKSQASQVNKNNLFCVLTFNEQLEQKEFITPVLPAGDFVGICRTVNRDLYIATCNNRTGVAIAKYPAGSEKASKTVNEPASFYAGLIGADRLNDYLTFSTDTLNNDKVYLSGTFKTNGEYLTIFNRYDFESGKHLKFRKVFEKDELKELEKSYVSISKEFKKLDLGTPKTMELVDQVVTPKGTFLMFTNFIVGPRGVYSGVSNIFSGGLLVYKLDENYKVKAAIGIPREFGSDVRADAQFFVTDNQLFAMASNEDKASFLVAAIDADKGQLTRILAGKLDDDDRSDYTAIGLTNFSAGRLTLAVMDRKMGLIGYKKRLNLYDVQF